jgi:hypothetical protein
VGLYYNDGGGEDKQKGFWEESEGIYISPISSERGIDIYCMEGDNW